MLAECVIMNLNLVLHQPPQDLDEREKDWGMYHGRLDRSPTSPAY